MSKSKHPAVKLVRRRLRDINERMRGLDLDSGEWPILNALKRLLKRRLNRLLASIHAGGAGDGASGASEGEFVPWPNTRVKRSKQAKQAKRRTASAAGAASTTHATRPRRPRRPRRSGPAKPTRADVLCVLVNQEARGVSCSAVCKLLHTASFSTIRAHLDALVDQGLASAAVVAKSQRVLYFATPAAAPAAAPAATLVAPAPVLRPTATPVAEEGAPW